MSSTILPPRFPPTSEGRDDSTYHFTAHQLERMIDAGILTDEDRVTLIDGHLIKLNGFEQITLTNSVQPITYGTDDSEYRFSLEQYERLVETGILTKDDRVEFLDNLLVKKMPIGPRHAGTTHIIGKRLARRLPEGWEARNQLPVRLGDMEPEPDIAVVFGSDETYLRRHPVAADLGLVIEVADTSLLRDQRDKSRIYAAAGIPEYWIVNLVDQRVEAHSGPDMAAEIPAYATVRFFGPGEMIPLTLGGAIIAELPVGELLVDLPPDEGTGSFAG